MMWSRGARACSSSEQTLVTYSLSDSSLFHISSHGCHQQALHLRTALRISKAQIDNQTSLGPPTAFLSPVPAVGSSKTGALPAGAFFLSLEAELSNKVKGLAYWKRVSVEVGNLMLQLQEDWLYLLLHFEKGECR